MTMRKGYSDGPFGQIHWRVIKPAKISAPPLFCFHPAPFSGLAFSGIMPLLAENRVVIAPDYPGYGGSDPQAGPASIEQYAQAMIAVAEDLAPNQEIDVLGFHTGCFVVAEYCLERPQSVRRAVMIDVPAFQEEQRQGFLEKLGPPELTSDLSCLESAWTSGIVKRLESQPMARAFEMFVEQLRPGIDMNAAFGAAFSYAWEEKLPGVKTQTLVMASQSPLHGPSLTAAEVIPSSTLIERTDIKRAVLDEAAAETAAEVNRFLK